MSHTNPRSLTHRLSLMNSTSLTNRLSLVSRMSRVKELLARRRMVVWCALILSLVAVAADAGRTGASSSPLLQTTQSSALQSQSTQSSSTGSSSTGSQSQSPQAQTEAQPERQVLRLRVRPKAGEAVRPMGRKRFFLVRGGAEEKRRLDEALKGARVVSRDCYYREMGASEALVAWLRENDCETVYCREARETNVEGAGAVPEFRAAYARGRREFGSRTLALKWLTVHLPEELRSGFYRRRQETLGALLRLAEEVSKAKVVSAMTDSKGTAYFTDLEPGAYLVSNLVPLEFGARSLLWNCEIKIKPGARGAETPYLISNVKDSNQVKCVAVEEPLPACEKPTPERRGQTNF